MLEKSEKKSGEVIFFWKSSQMFEKSEKKIGRGYFFEIVSKKTKKFRRFAPKHIDFALKYDPKYPKFSGASRRTQFCIFFNFLLGEVIFFEILLKSSKNLQKKSREVINFENVLQFDHFLRFWKKYEIRGYS